MKTVLSKSVSPWLYYYFFLIWNWFVHLGLRLKVILFKKKIKSKIGACLDWSSAVSATKTTNQAMTLGEDMSKQSVLWRTWDEVSGQQLGMLLCSNWGCFLRSYLRVRHHLPFILLNCPRHRFFNECSLGVLAYAPHFSANTCFGNDAKCPGKWGKGIPGRGLSTAKALSSSNNGEKGCIPIIKFHC